jgi:hypothetical protein
MQLAGHVCKAQRLSKAVLGACISRAQGRKLGDTALTSELLWCARMAQASLAHATANSE